MSDKGRLVLSPEQMQELVDEDPDGLLLSDEARAASVAATGAAPAPASAAVEEKSVPAPVPVPAAVEPPATVEIPTEVAPVVPVEPVVEEGALSEDDLAALGRLDSFLNEQVDAKVASALKGRDQTITRLQKEHTEALKTLRQELRETKLVGLTEDEQKVLQKKWAFEDRNALLDEREAALDGYDKDLMIATFTLKFGQYGVTEEGLADKSVAEMELFCAETKASHFEKLAQGGIHAAAPQKSSASVVSPAPAPPAPVVPAGLTAPSDVGSGTPAPQEQEFDPGQGRDVMAKNLSNLPVETIQVRKA